MVTSPDFQSSSPHPPERGEGAEWGGGLEMDFSGRPLLCDPGVRGLAATLRLSLRRREGQPQYRRWAPRGLARRLVIQGSLQAARFWRLRNLGLSVVSSRTALLTSSGITQKG